MFLLILRASCAMSVDWTCRDRLTSEYGIEEKKIRVLHNSVDLDRFLPRGPLPSRPQSAVAFSNTSGEHISAIREACARTGMKLQIDQNHLEVLANRTPYSEVKYLESLRKKGSIFFLL